MLQQQFLEIIKKPLSIQQKDLADLELLISEYPFFETAHLLYVKGLHSLQSINYSKQLRKTAIIANSRSVLYELIHKRETNTFTALSNGNDGKESEKIINENASSDEVIANPQNSVSITNNEIKVVYVNTISNSNPISDITDSQDIVSNQEIDFVKQIENDTEAEVLDFVDEKFKRDIELEISKGIVHSYVQTDIIKTPELTRDEKATPSSFTDWLKTIQKEAHTFQTKTNDVKVENPEIKQNPQNIIDNPQKASIINQKKQLIDKIIESDPGRIKLGSNKFFTPAIDAKQSLLENEHLVTETLAKIYALQGNISKAIRAYEILSLKFPQKSVYFASLIEKLKNNK